MRVICKNNTLSNLNSESTKCRLRRSIRLEGAIADLRIGDSYEVAAVEQRDGGLWIYVHSVTNREYPYPFPIELFGIIDSTCGDDWRVKFEEGDAGQLIKRLTFPEWADDEEFYEKLVEGDKFARAVFRRRFPR